MTGDDFRRLALALNDATEGAHMGHPDFRANGRIFASLTAGEDWAVVMVTPDEQKALLRSDPDVFVPAAGAWGRQGCTKIWLASANKADVRGALTLAWERIVTLPPPRAAKKRKAGVTRG
jgi:hypothetical protein